MKARGGGKDRPVAVEALAGHGDVAVLEQVRFDYGLEGGFGMAANAHSYN